MADPWVLVQRGDFITAIERYSALIHAEPAGTFHRHNRGLAFLLMNEYASALKDFQWNVQKTDPRYRSSSESLNAGICCWCLNRPDETLIHWKESMTAPYADAAGGVTSSALLLYAAERLDDDELRKESMASLRQFWQKHMKAQRRKKPQLTHDDLVHPGLVAWPGAVVPFLLDELDEATFVQKSENSPVELLRQRHRCVADFYVAVSALRKSDRPGFSAGMKACSKSPYGLLEHEFYLAQWEVRQNFPERVLR